MDFGGLNYESSLPRDMAFYRAWLREHDVEPTGWKRLRSEIKPRDTAFYRAWLKKHSAEPTGWKRLLGRIKPHVPRKRNDIRQVDATTDLAAERYIFCPLQTHSVFGDWVTSIDPLIDVLHAASRHLPEKWHLRLKEHPKSKVNFSRKIMELENERFRLDNTTDTMQQVAAAHAVVTLDSCVGFEAFFYDKPVLVLSKAFYGFGGLAEKVDSIEALCDMLSNPHALGFDAGARNAFMSFIIEESWFPKTEDVIAGRYTIEDVIARDRRMQALRERYRQQAR